MRAVQDTHQKKAPGVAQAFQRRLANIAPLTDTPAADYLRSRGIDPALAGAVGTGYVDGWEHWRKDGGRWMRLGTTRRVVFPRVDRQGEVVAISARAIDTDFIEPKIDTRGERANGVFATTGALVAEVLVITGAPIDALSLASAGLPAIALCGTSGPDWLLQAAAFKTELLATDNDEAGDKAAHDLAARFTFGSRCWRLRPIGKDWNADLVQLGAEALAASLGRAIPPPRRRESLPSSSAAPSHAIAPEPAHPPQGPAVASAPQPTPAPQDAETVETLRGQLLDKGGSLGWIALGIERGLTIAEGGRPGGRLPSLCPPSSWPRWTRPPWPWISRYKACTGGVRSCGTLRRSRPPSRRYRRRYSGGVPRAMARRHSPDRPCSAEPGRTVAGAGHYAVRTQSAGVAAAEGLHPRARNEQSSDPTGGQPNDGASALASQPTTARLQDGHAQTCPQMLTGAMYSQRTANAGDQQGGWL